MPFDKTRMPVYRDPLNRRCYAAPIVEVRTEMVAASVPGNIAQEQPPGEVTFEKPQAMEASVGDFLVVFDDDTAVIERPEAFGAAYRPGDADRPVEVPPAPPPAPEVPVVASAGAASVTPPPPRKKKSGGA